MSEVPLYTPQATRHLPIVIQITDPAPTHTHLPVVIQIAATAVLRHLGALV